MSNFLTNNPPPQKKKKCTKTIIILKSIYLQCLSWLLKILRKNVEPPFCLLLAPGSASDTRTYIFTIT